MMLYRYSIAFTKLIFIMILRFLLQTYVNDLFDYNLSKFLIAKLVGNLNNP